MPLQQRLKPALASKRGSRQSDSNNSAEENLNRTKILYENERKKANYVSQERDKMQQFWEITKGQLSQEKVLTLESRQALEHAKSEHLNEVLDLSHKIKTLMLARNVSQKLAEVQTEDEVLREETKVDTSTIAIQTSAEDENHSKQRRISMLSPSSFNEMVPEENSNISTVVLETLRAELTEQFQNELKIEAEHKNQQFFEIINHHQTEMENLRMGYEKLLTNEREKIQNYQDQVTSNLALNNEISSELQNERDTNETLTSNVKLQETEIQHLKNKLKDSDNNRQKTQRMQNELKQTKKKLQESEEKNELLRENVRKVQSERDKLYDEFSKAVRLVQDKVEIRDASLNELIFRSEKLLTAGQSGN